MRLTWTVGVCGVLTGAWACGSAFTSSETGASGASTSSSSAGSGTGGTGGGGGTSAVATAASTTGGMSTATSTGSAMTCPACGPGEYCSKKTAQCLKCADFSSFEFGPPVKLEVPNKNGTNQRFPRPTHNKGEMVFRNTAGDTQALQYTSDVGSNAGTALQGVTQASQGQSGPLEAFVTVSGTMVNFFWDSGTAAGNRTLYMGTRSGSGVSGALALPAPFNSGGSSFSIAVAAQTQRAWWMYRSLQAATAGLVTTSYGNMAVSPPAPLQIILSTGCLRAGGDATPWVSPDGKLMLFRSIETDKSCTPGKDVNDLFYVGLNGFGQPDNPAEAIVAINKPGWDDTDPALSADFCTLYFASDEGMGEYDLFAAKRQ